MKLLWNFWNGFCIFDLKTSCISSHLHYNNVSCILRCVFTLLQTNVLVGLDWVEPMMLLLLHITCSCIFMHTFFTFSILLYTELYWDFSNCLFLLLSLLLSVSCVMAPKQKSTPSQNPLHFGHSTSSDPIPSHVRFYDEKAKSDFFENFSRQGVHSECQVILSNFSDIDLPTIIYNREDRKSVV